MKKLLSFVAAASLLALGSVALAQALARHPHLQSAHQHLQAAMQELKAANDGKTQFGGHRERAEQLVRQAAAQIEQAAQYANAHGGKWAVPPPPAPKGQ